jgi:hypothetical protein
MLPPMHRPKIPPKVAEMEIGLLQKHRGSMHIFPAQNV